MIKIKIELVQVEIGCQQVFVGLSWVEKNQALAEPISARFRCQKNTSFASPDPAKAESGVMPSSGLRGADFNPSQDVDLQVRSINGLPVQQPPI